MTALLPLIFLAISITQDQTPLRTGCTAEEQTIANLPAGTEVEIRFAMLGGTAPCYKVAANLEGKQLTGYVAAKALQGLEAFKKGVQDAPRVDVRQVMDAVRPVVARAVPTTSAKLAMTVKQAVALIDSGQPQKALEVIGPEARSAKDPVVLAVAGAAAWRSDDSAKALEYWRAALVLQHDPQLESLYKQVEKENNNDKSTSRLYGNRVTLRYEDGAIPLPTARAIVTELDKEFTRISGEVGCPAQERIIAIAQSPDSYRKTTDAAEWSGGQYDGRIRVPVAPAESQEGEAVDSTLRRALGHEMTHACLSLMGTWPAWLQEGLAQKLSGDSVSPRLHATLEEWRNSGKLPKLANLGQDWSRMDTEHALAAYGLSLEAVDLLYESYGVAGLRNLLHNPERAETIATDLDAKLGL